MGRCEALGGRGGVEVNADALMTNLSVAVVLAFLPNRCDERYIKIPIIRLLGFRLFVL